MSTEMTAKANAWFGPVLRAEDNPVKMELNFEVRGKKGAQKAQ